MALNISCLHTRKPPVGEKGKSSEASGGFVHLEFTQVSVRDWEEEILLSAQFSDFPPPPPPLKKGCFLEEMSHRRHILCLLPAHKGTWVPETVLPQGCEHTGAPADVAF